MESDPEKAIEDTEEGPNNRKKLNTLVAITIALLATFMGICRVKDNNITQAMQTNTADQVERWAILQAHVTRAEIATGNADRFRLQAQTLPPEEREGFLQRAADYQNIARKESELREKAEQRIREDRKVFKRWRLQHDKFDLSEAALSIAIAILAIAALIQIHWLYWVAMIPSAFGILMGLAGFFRWNIEPEQLVRFLGA